MASSMCLKYSPCWREQRSALIKRERDKERGPKWRLQPFSTCTRSAGVENPRRGYRLRNKGRESGA
eukprot:6194104-Pleurochrysis_carterae.AAC.1